LIKLVHKPACQCRTGDKTAGRRLKEKICVTQLSFSAVICTKQSVTNLPKCLLTKGPTHITKKKKIFSFSIHVRRSSINPQYLSEEELHFSQNNVQGIFFGMWVLSNCCIP